MTAPVRPRLRVKFGRIVTLAVLIAAGESAFFLPFLIARVFRPTLLEVFGLTNIQLGTAFAVYGVVAMIAYFAGGPLADCFSSRKLLTIALISTAAGGFLMATMPSFTVVMFVYGFWGVTTILLFWAPLMRATREWGGSEAPGAAFGLLDGGRGFLAATVGSVTVGLFALMMPDDVDSASFAERSEALKRIIVFVSLVTFGVALLTWFALPEHRPAAADASPRFVWTGVRRVLAMPTVWLQAFIIICAYAGFKATDDISLYAHEVLEFNEMEAARAGTVSLWMRPVAAVVAGFLADRTSASRMTMVSFALLIAGSAVLASGWLRPGTAAIFFMSLISASLGIFALRGLYYAIMEEGQVPFAFTGSAVGVVSVIGYTPDVFMGPLMGQLLDQSPGPIGHQHVFWVVAAFAFAGLLGTFVFQRAAKRW